MAALSEGDEECRPVSRLFPGKVLKKLPSGWVRFEDKGRKLGQGKGEKETGERKRHREEEMGKWGRETETEKGCGQTRGEPLSSTGCQERPYSEGISPKGLGGPSDAAARDGI